MSSIHYYLIWLPNIVFPSRDFYFFRNNTFGMKEQKDYTHSIELVAENGACKKGIRSPLRILLRVCVYPENCVCMWKIERVFQGWVISLKLIERLLCMFITTNILLIISNIHDIYSHVYTAICLTLLTFTRFYARHTQHRFFFCFSY